MNMNVPLTPFTPFITTKKCYVNGIPKNPNIQNPNTQNPNIQVCRTCPQIITNNLKGDCPYNNILEQLKANDQRDHRELKNLKDLTERQRQILNENQFKMTNEMNQLKGEIGNLKNEINQLQNKLSSQFKSFNTLLNDLNCPSSDLPKWVKNKSYFS